MTKRIAPGILVLLVVGTALGLVLLAQASDQTEPAIAVGEPLLVATQPLRLESRYSLPQSYTGVVRSPRDSLLGFELGGAVSEVLVDEGQIVEADEPLARLDQRKLRAREREILARLKAQEVTLRELQQGPRQQTIAAAKARVERLDADIALAESQLKRIELLRSRDAVSQDDFDQARFSLESLRSQRQTAQMEYDELLAGTREEQVQAQEALVEQLQATADEIALQIEDATLRAPFRGQITRRFVNQGSIVAAGESIVRIVQVDQLEVWIGVPHQVLEQVEPGATYPIRIGSREYAARLDSILAELDRATRTQTLVFRILDGEDRPPAIADLARLSLTVDVQADGSWVPLQSLTRGPRGLWSIYLAEPVADPMGSGSPSASSVRPSGPTAYRVRRVEVESLHPTSDRVYVRGPIAEGDQLIVSGLHKVVPGQECRVDD